VNQKPQAARLRLVDMENQDHPTLGTGGAHNKSIAANLISDMFANLLSSKNFFLQRKVYHRPGKTSSKK